MGNSGAQSLNVIVIVTVIVIVGNSGYCYIFVGHQSRNVIARYLESVGSITMPYDRVHIRGRLSLLKYYVNDALILTLCHICIDIYI